MGVFSLSKLILRISAFVMATAVIMLSAAGCRSSDTAGKETKKVTFKIMSWNDDFRKALETYFIPRHKELMDGVEITWINDEVVGYQANVENRLENGESIDIFVGSDEMCAHFSNNSNVAALTELGIDDQDLAQQYPYTRLLGSDQNGVQKGSAMNAEPGILLYRADYAEQYLGVTNQQEMQRILSSWDTFITTAKTIDERSEGKVKMLSDSSEIWRSIDAAMTGHWLSEGRLSVSDATLTHWLEYMDELDASNALSGIKPFDDDWSEAVNDGVFCFYAAPWLAKSTSSENADITTIFSLAKRGGKSFGKFKAASAPNGFVYGGSWLYSSVNSQNKEIAGEIIRAFTCDGEFMRLLALGNMEYVNNAAVIGALAEQNISNPLFDGLDAFSVYISAAQSLELTSPSIYDSAVSKLLYNQAKSYSQGKVSADEAIYNFKNNVWKKFKDITTEPQKPNTKTRSKN